MEDGTWERDKPINNDAVIFFSWRPRRTESKPDHSGGGRLDRGIETGKSSHSSDLSFAGFLGAAVSEGDHARFGTLVMDGTGNPPFTGKWVGRCLGFYPKKENQTKTITFVSI